MSSVSRVPAYHSSGLPLISEHAAERWVQRVCGQYDDVAPWDLPYAFLEAVPVGLPASERQARLYAPTHTLILYTRDLDFQVLVTVLPERQFAINDDHLSRCHDCGLRYDPSDGFCKWCSEN